MSHENAEIVERQFTAWNAGDFDEWAATWTDDVEAFAPEGWPEGGVFRGLDDWRHQAERLRNTWAEARVEIDDIRALEDDRVLVRIRYVTKGAGTGIPFDTPLAAVFFMADGKIERARYFWRIDEALEAAGLRE